MCVDCKNCSYRMKRLQVICPHCGVKQYAMIDFENRSCITKVCCDVEMGGCDQYFIVKWEAKTEINVTTGVFIEKVFKEE